jgi:hypothetical protein
MIQEPAAERDRQFTTTSPLLVQDLGAVWRRKRSPTKGMSGSKFAAYQQTAAAFPPSSVVASSVSTIAIRAIMTARTFTSAGFGKLRRYRSQRAAFAILERRTQ